MLALRATAPSITRSRPAQLIAALWLASAAYLLFAGHATWLALITAMTLFELVLVLVTLRVTQPPAVPVAAQGPRGRVVAQAILILAIVAITALSGLLPGGIPGWSPMVAGFQQVGERILPVDLVGGPGNAVANPMQYFVIPLALLLLLAARPRELGLGQGYCSWRATLVWAVVPLLAWTVLLAAGLLPLRVLVRRVLGNALQNGFFEEFLFRGALQTRLTALMPGGWALVIQALIFGLWHIQSNTTMLGGDWAAGLAACVVSQSLTGLWFGVVFARTRNLLAPSVAHVMMNAFGQTLG